VLEGDRLVAGDLLSLAAGLSAAGGRGLENGSRRAHRVRRRCWTAAQVLELRDKKPLWGKGKTGRCHGAMWRGLS